ncbi:MAG: amidohydrolase family protein [bacterium]|nr:amidohydrolase family protein [bacterium]
MTNESLKIDNARFLITVDPERRMIRDGTIVTDGQRITHVGKTAALTSVHADRVIDATEMVVTPGFINGHLHVSYAHATRGIFPDDLGADYLPNVFKLQAAMTEEEEYHTSLLGITELLKYGTTTFVDPGSTKFLDACMEVYEQAGCRIIVGAHNTDLPNPVNVPVYETAAAVNIMQKTIETFNGRLDGRVQAWAMPFAADYATRDLLVQAKRLADAYGVSMTLHQSNDQASIDLHQEKYGMRPVEYLEDIGVLGPNVVLAHVIGVDEAEIAAMARTESKAVMALTNALKQGVGLHARGKLPEMLEAGVCVGLATDAGNNSNLIETMRSMYLVSVFYKDARRSNKMIPPETAVEMATIKGAMALGLGDQIGSIEVGKKADLVLFDTKRPEWRTLFNPINNLVYSADGRSVHTVIVDGRVVVENHTPQYVDEWQLIQKVQELGEGMLKRTGVSFPPKWPVI